MTDHTPTTSSVRDRYAACRIPKGVRATVAKEEFDRWLAEHDAKVRAETLREARDNVRASSFWADGSDNYAGRVRGYLNFEADRIEREAGLK